MESACKKVGLLQKPLTICSELMQTFAGEHGQGWRTLQTFHLTHLMLLQSS